VADLEEAASNTSFISTFEEVGKCMLDHFEKYREISPKPPNLTSFGRLKANKLSASGVCP